MPRLPRSGEEQGHQDKFFYCGAIKKTAAANYLQALLHKFHRVLDDLGNFGHRKPLC